MSKTCWYKAKFNEVCDLASLFCLIKYTIHPPNPKVNIFYLAVLMIKGVVLNSSSNDKLQLQLQCYLAVIGKPFRARSTMSILKLF